jgi:membrane-bound serine protease (ClpP class)
MRGTARTIGQLGIGLSLCAGLVLSAHPALGQTDQPVIVQVELNGVVDPIVADHIVSAVDRANADGAEAVLLIIDTPGGLGSSMDQIDQALLNSAVPVIGYVAPIGARAASAGAFILLSCPVAPNGPGHECGRLDSDRSVRRRSRHEGAERRAGLDPQTRPDVRSK